MVDDEQLSRWFATGLLEDHGFEVIEAEDAAAALKALESHHDVRLLFTDIQMPGKLNVWAWRERFTRGGRMSYSSSLPDKRGPVAL